MITPQAGKVDLANSAEYGAHLKIELEHADGSMFDLGDLSGYNWLDEAEWGKTVDDPQCNVTIKIRREIGGLSLAPLVEDSTLNQVLGEYAKRIHFARRFVIKANITTAGVEPASGEWFPVLTGRTDKVSWGGKSSVITITARDYLRLLDYRIKTGEETQWGTAAGISMEQVAQAILNHYLSTSAPVIHFETASDFSVTSFKAEAGSTLYEVLNQLTGHIGRFVEWKWWASDSDFKLVVPSPHRNSETATPVATIGPDQYLDIRRFEWDINSVRNFLRIRFREKATNSIVTRELKNEASIAELGGEPEGIQYIEFTEPESSAIDTISEADDYLTLAEQDLGSPLISQEVENLFWPWVELGDYIQWEPNFKTTDSAFAWAVVGFRHRWSRTERRTFFSTSGQAKGGQKRYRRRETEESPTQTEEAARRSVLRIKRIKKTDTYTDLEPVVGPDVWRIFVYEQVWAIGELDRHDPLPSERVGQIEPGGVWRATAPQQGFEKIVYFVPITEGFVVGDGMEYAVGPISAQAVPEFIYIEQRPNNSIELRISDPDNLGGTLEVWTNPDSVTSPNVSEPVDALLTIPSTPYTVLSTESTALSNIMIHPTDGKMVTFRFTDTNDVTTGLRAFYMQGHTSLVTLADKLKVDAVERDNILALAVNDLKIADLAITNAKVALLAVDTANVVNAAMTDVKIATNAITELKIVDTAVSSVKIASQAVTTAKLGLLAVTDAILAANAVTETKITNDAVTTNKILAANVVAGKIATSAVITDKLDALAVTTAKINTSAVVTDKIDALQITSAKIATGAIITDKIDALAITSAKIAAGAIIAGKLSAGAIDATNIIAAGIITGSLIATGTITGTNIAGATISGGHIVGLTITGAHISSGTITADKLTVSDLSAITANLGTVKVIDDSGSLDFWETTDFYASIWGKASGMTGLYGKGITIEVEGGDQVIIGETDVSIGYPTSAPITLWIWGDVFLDDGDFATLATVVGMPNLPTADPGIPGNLWVDSNNFVKRSA